MTKLVIIFAAICIASSASCLHADSEAKVTESYNGSPNLPDWASYSMFLAQSKAFVDDPEHGNSYFAEVLGVDHKTPEGETTIEFYKNWFTASLLEIQHQASSKELQALCSGDWRSMSADDYSRAQMDVEAYWERLYQEHLTATLGQMQPEVRAAFEGFLQDRKKYISHTKVDLSGVYKSMQEEELRKTHENSCQKARNLNSQ